MIAFSKALEIIPKWLASNAGLDPTEIINKLRKFHNDEKQQEKYRWFGINL